MGVTSKNIINVNPKDEIISKNNNKIELIDKNNNNKYETLNINSDLNKDNELSTYHCSNKDENEKNDRVEKTLETSKNIINVNQKDEIISKNNNKIELTDKNNNNKY